MIKEDYIKQVLLSIVSSYFQESNYISSYERCRVEPMTLKI